MDRTSIVIMMAAGGLVLFLLVLRLAFGPFHSVHKQDLVNSFIWDETDEPEKPWVSRAQAKMAKLPVPPRPAPAELPGWSWQAVERDPVMSVQIDDRSSDGRRVSGHITCTPGTLKVACSVRTGLRLLEGWITLTPEGGAPMTLKAGDSLVLQPGFSGSWENESMAFLSFEILRL